MSYKLADMKDIKTGVLKASETRQQWGRVLNRVYRGESRILVEKSGIPVAAIISPDDLERFTRYEDEQRRQFGVLDTMRDTFKDWPAEEIESETARAVEQARCEGRAASAQ